MATPKKPQLDMFQFDWEMAEFRLRKMLELARLPSKPTYCAKEVASIFGTDLSTVYRLIENTTLNSIQLHSGHKVRHKRVDFVSLVQYIGEYSRDE